MVREGYVLLMLSRNRPTEIVAIPLVLFSDGLIRTAAQPTPALQLVALNEIGRGLVGSRITVTGDKVTWDDGNVVIYVKDRSQIYFHE